ncbi:MAG: hypothetical protein L0209_12585, partial [candidate division Zixibacteria bacterium]|nr:hypothetical protein [candidate division Zixibacteria bacterium]
MIAEKLSMTHVDQPVNMAEVVRGLFAFIQKITQFFKSGLPLPRQSVMNGTAASQQLLIVPVIGLDGTNSCLLIKMVGEFQLSLNAVK